MTRDYFYCLQSYHRPANYLSTAVQLTNRLLRFGADGGFVYYKRVSSPSFLVWSQSLIGIITSWFAIALDEIRTTRILRERVDCKQSSETWMPLQARSCFPMMEPYEETCYLWTRLRFVSVLHENGTVSDRYESNSCRVSDRHQVRPVSEFIVRPFPCKLMKRNV